MFSVEAGQMAVVETGQMPAAETGQMSAVETRQMLKSQIRGRGQNHQNGTKWTQNGSQNTRIGQNESYHDSGAFLTGPVAKSPAKCNELPITGPLWSVPGRSEGLAARGYFIPGGASQRGGWSGSGVPCRTLSDTVTC